MWQRDAPPDGLAPPVGFRVLFQSQIASQKYFSFSILVKFNVCTLIYILGGVKDPANDFRRKQKRLKLRTCSVAMNLVK